MAFAFVCAFTWYIIIGLALGIWTGAYRNLNRREWMFPVAIALWPFFMLLLIAFVLAWMLQDEEP